MDHFQVRLNWWMKGPNTLEHRLQEKILGIVRTIVSTSFVILSGWTTYVVINHFELRDVPLLSLMSISWMLALLAWVFK